MGKKDDILKEMVKVLNDKASDVSIDNELKMVEEEIKLNRDILKEYEDLIKSIDVEDVRLN